MRAKVVKILSAVGAAVVAIVVALLTQTGDETGANTAAPLSPGVTSTVSVQPTSGPATAGDSPVVSRAAGVPERAYETLAEIDAGRWPDSANAPGTKGGITFQNREGRLPAAGESGARVKYQEWDVNPKKRGQSRDAERIVTGSDGSAWYTGDHYDTFTRMR